MTAATFYADEHLGNAFGITGPPYGPEGHRGQDVVWGSGAAIPSYVEGTVVASGWLVVDEFRATQRGTSALGWCVVVYCERLRIWVGYCHLVERGAAVGATVSIGTTVGRVGNTGTASRGAHLHTTVSKTGVSPATARVTNPLPYIKAARATTAGGGVVPIPPREVSDGDMPDYDYVFTKTYPKSPMTRYAIGHPTLIPDGVKVTTTVAEAEGWNLATGLAAREIGGANWDKAIAGMKQLAVLARAAAGSGISVTVTPDPAVLEQLEQQTELAKAAPLANAAALLDATASRLGG